MKRYYCTYFDRNYLIKGLTLIESLKRHEKTDFQVFVVCFDDITRIILDKLHIERVTTIPLHLLEQRDFPLLEAKQNRSLVEYYWTLTATVLLRIIENNPEIDVLTYLDADLFFYSSPDPIFDEMGKNSILIHEHRFSPEQAFLEPYGKYNVGLLCFRNNTNGLEAINWWRDRCIEWCYARLENGKYGDQLYLNDWPTRFQKVAVLQNIGAGVGPWNHIQYSFRAGEEGTGVLVNDTPLVFYHFHSFSFVRPEIIIPSRYPTNPLTKDILRLCFIPYMNALLPQIEKIRNILPDFTFGVNDEAGFDSRHTFVAKRGLAPALREAGVSQTRIAMDEEWDCYCSNQLVEFSKCIHDANESFEKEESNKALSVVMSSLSEFPESNELQALRAELENQGADRERALLELLEASPKNARAHAGLGSYYFNGRDRKKALYHYEKAASLQPYNILFLKLIGHFYHAVEGRMEDALNIYSRIIALEPSNVEVLLIVGHLYVSLMKLDEAKACYERVLKIDPNKMDAKENLGGILKYQASKIYDWKTEDGVKRREDGSLKSEVGNQKPTQENQSDEWIGGRLDEKKAGEQTTDDRVRGAGIKEGDTPGSDYTETTEKIYQDAQSLIERGKQEDAIGSLERLLESDPGYAGAHNDLGVLYSGMGDQDKSLLHYKKAVALQPENLVFQKNLAGFHCSEAGGMEKAMEIYLKILESNPEDVETLSILGHICLSLEKPEDAKVFFERALDVEPWNTTAREGLEQAEKGPEMEVGDRRSEDREQKADDGGQISDGVTQADEWMGGRLDGGGAEVGGQELDVNDSEMYQNIQKLIDEGRQDEALEALEDMLVSHPDHAEAHNDLGVLYANEGNNDEAIFHYRKAMALQPENLIFQKNLAGFFCNQQGGIEEAMQIYLKILETNPADVEVLVILGHICLSVEKPDDAKIFFEKALDLEPWNVDARDGLERAEKGPETEVGGRRSEDREQEAEDGGQISDGVTQADEWMGGRLDEGDAEVGGQGLVISDSEMYQNIQKLIDEDRQDEAIKELVNMLAIYPDHAEAHNDLGVLYANEGNNDQAIFHYRKAMALQPENLIFQKNLAGFFCGQQGGMEEAMQIYLKILESDPADIETLLILGYICSSMEKSDDAKVFFNKVLDVEPWNVDARDGLEQIERAEDGGQLSNGLNHSDEWMGGRLDGGDAEVGSPKLELGDSDTYQDAQDLINEGRYEDAIEMLEQLLVLNSGAAATHNDLGVLYGNAGDVDQAQTHYEMALQLEPENVMFQKNLAGFHCSEAGGMEKAMEIYLNILESNLEDIETLSILGHICLSLEKPEDAKVFFERALDVEPWNTTAREGLEQAEKEQRTEVGGQRSERQ